MPYVFRDTVKGSPENAMDIPAQKSQVLWETFAQAYEENPAAAFNRWMDLSLAGMTGTQLTAESARAKLKAAGLENHLKVSDAGITDDALNTLMFRKRQELRRQEIQARSPGGFAFGAEKLALGIGTTFMDPIAVGLNFVPIVGEARYGALLKSASGVLGRTAVRAGVGAAEGAVGTAIYEPIIAGMRRSEQADYTMADSLLNVAFGAAGGAGLHVTVGSLAEVFGRLRPRTFEEPKTEAPSPELTQIPQALPQVIAPPAVTATTEIPARELGSVAAAVENMTPDQRQSTLRAAVGQAVTGEPIDVAPAVRAAQPAAVDTRVENLRNELEWMAGTAGWAQKGGEIIREFTPEDARAVAAGQMTGYGKVVGRTKWIPNEPWFSRTQKEAPLKGNMGGSATREVVRKAIAGEKLTKPEQRHLESMLAEAAGLREDAIQEGLRDFDLETAAVATAPEHLDSTDAVNMALVEKAMAIDEVAVERAAKTHENDDAAYMAEIRRIISEQGTPVNAGGEALQGTAGAQASTDLLGTAPPASAQEFERRRLERQVRERASPDVQLGAGSLFSNENLQTDLTDLPEPKTAPLAAEEGQTKLTSEQLQEDAEAEAQLAEAEATELGKRLEVDPTVDKDVAMTAEAVKKADRWARVAELVTTCILRGD